MRIFVTGGTGFIGSSLVQRLILEGHEVRVLARSEHAIKIVHDLNAAPIAGDITEPGTWQDDVPSANTVVHCAAFVSDWGRRREYQHVNVNGTRNILDAVKDWGGDFVHISSMAVHGFRPGAYNEASPIRRGGHPYCDSKAAAEQLIDTAVAEGLKASIVRITAVYGPGDPHIIIKFLEQAKSGRIFIIGKGNQPSNMIYIDDVIEGLMSLIRKGCEPGERYVLNNPLAPDMLSLIKRALEALELNARIIHMPLMIARGIACLLESKGYLSRNRPRLTHYAVIAMGNSCTYSTEITMRNLNWSPKTSIEEGFSRTISWYRRFNPTEF
jgi:nucleoside-diphosphate-sugar epimerase